MLEDFEKKSGEEFKAPAITGADHPYGGRSWDLPYKSDLSRTEGSPTKTCIQCGALLADNVCMCPYCGLSS